MSDQVVQIVNPDGESPVLLVCEHASHAIPDDLNGLGLTAQEAISHVAWDPGAMATATLLSQALDARLIASRISRLVYDANRPPEAPDAIPARSEQTHIAGNVDLSAASRSERVTRYYTPFRDALAAQVAARPAPVIVTIHSFTPVYNGKERHVEIGVLHDTDTRLADAMLAEAARFTDLQVERNAPYGPEDGVTHTLLEHAIRWGHPNVMLEIRNDLIADAQGQARIAGILKPWLTAALSALKVAA